MRQRFDQIFQALKAAWLNSSSIRKLLWSAIGIIGTVLTLFLTYIGTMEPEVKCSLFPFACYLPTATPTATASVRLTQIAETNNQTATAKAATTIAGQRQTAIALITPLTRIPISTTTFTPSPTQTPTARNEPTDETVATQDLTDEPVVTEEVTDISMPPTTIPTNTPIPPTLTYTPSPTNAPTLTPSEMPIATFTAMLTETASVVPQTIIEWSPIAGNFDGTSMVLVPDCDLLQSENDGAENIDCVEKRFWVDRHEVTNAAYKMCVEAGGCFLPDDLRYYSDNTKANYPVVFVNWFMAEDYCQWRGKQKISRLPTAKEWIDIAAGPNGWRYPWGNQFYESLDYLVYAGNSNQLTSVQPLRLSGASWISAVDLSGSVWEWVTVDVGGSGILRGGAWNSVEDSNDLTTQGTLPLPSDYLGSVADKIGFRCISFDRN